MGTLLKDMPIHMERIENNYSLKGLISDEIECGCELCFSTTIDGIEGDGFSRGDNAEGFVEIENLNVLSEKVLKVIVDFVNQNYEWRGAKACK